MPTDVELNGVDLSTYGLTARQAPDLLGTAQHSYAAIIRPDRPGARVGLRTIATKPFSIDGILESTSLASAVSNLDNIKAVAMAAQPSTLIMGWSTTLRLTVECLGVQVTPLGSPFGVFKYDVRLLFDAANPPFWEGATEHSVASVQSTGVDLPAGNAPFWPQVAVQGPTSDVELLLNNSTGGQESAIKFTGIDLASSTEYLLVDMSAQTVYQADSVTWPGSSGTLKLDAMTTSGDFFGVLSSQYDFAASSWAQLRCVTGGTSGGTATAYYRKAYR